MRARAHERCRHPQLRESPRTLPRRQRRPPPPRQTTEKELNPLSQALPPSGTLSPQVYHPSGTRRPRVWRRSTVACDFTSGPDPSNHPSNHFTSGPDFYLYSTSNHNKHPLRRRCDELSFISILHQTTTVVVPSRHTVRLSFISILHQTTTTRPSGRAGQNCLLSLFYIKPQHTPGNPQTVDIVFYLYSTSNHNLSLLLNLALQIVFYLYSTSNHNTTTRYISFLTIVFYLYSTSNHNMDVHSQPFL